MQARASGVLLPVFSLPGPYGTGTLGAPARQFVNFLADAGQKFWQILPLVPPGGGDSPYMSASCFAGNPLLLDPEALADEGLLTHEELSSVRLTQRRGILLFSAHHPLAGKPGLALADFRDEPFYVTAPPTMREATMELLSLCADADFLPAIEYGNHVYLIG